MAQPIHIIFAIVPGKIDDRAFAASPALVFRPITTATAALQAGIPFAKGDLEFADRIGGRDGDAVPSLRLLVGRGEPMVKSPAGITTIWGQRAQSLKAGRAPGTRQMAGGAERRC